MQQRFKTVQTGSQRCKTADSSRIDSQQASADGGPERSESFPITLSVGYGWSEHHGTGGLNDHWRFLRNEVQKAAAELEKRGDKRRGAKNPLRISINRLRGRHGNTLIGGLLQKIDRSDILFFDISGKNPNVHFELGYALAQKGAGSGRVYVFSEEGEKACSDLTGYMLSQYRLNTASGKPKKGAPLMTLLDPIGFRSALVASLIEVAKDRGMWGYADTVIETESNTEN